MNKFYARKTHVDGVQYDSKLEARRNAQLQLLQRAGQIRNLERQVVFELEVKGAKVCKFIVDHTFFEADKFVVEEVKSPATRTPVYILKAKILRAMFPGLDFREWPERKRKKRKKV